MRLCTKSKVLFLSVRPIALRHSERIEDVDGRAMKKALYIPSDRGQHLILELSSSSPEKGVIRIQEHGVELVCSRFEHFVFDCTSEGFRLSAVCKDCLSHNLQDDMIEIVVPVSPVGTVVDDRGNSRP